ncbi:hypothetical protein ACPEER_05300 [Pasteurella sp. PK-2025]|uniref:hypothetical protein n=1 Tax=Pasteurella sp. PK-2025 TaxID=3413133 RepID=UPI003C745E15
MLEKLIGFLKKLDEENKKMKNFDENDNCDNLVNTNGLPMSNGIDAEGNPFGCDDED